jgi:hypothetical protein
MLVATLGGPTMFARIGVMTALNRHVERLFNPDRKDKRLGETKVSEALMTKVPPDRDSGKPAVRKPGAHDGYKCELCGAWIDAI